MIGLGFPGVLIEFSPPGLKSGNHKKDLSSTVQFTRARYRNCIELAAAVSSWQDSFSLGEGGIGLYRATGPKLDRDVPIKVGQA
jgi:hypothetical protein